MGGERGDAGFSATSKSGSTSLFNIGWLVAVLEVGAHGKGDKPVMTWRTVVVLGPAAITIEDKRARDTPDTSQEIVVFLYIIVSPRYLISSSPSIYPRFYPHFAFGMCRTKSDVSRRPLISHRGKSAFLELIGTCWDGFWRSVRAYNP